MKYDFLFVYEVKNRELENICLIACELKRRGYSVCVRETWEKKHHPRRRIYAEVVVTFALYGNSQVVYLSSFTRKLRKIVNLQWEQLFSIADEQDEESHRKPENQASKAVFISWGKYNKDMLTDEADLDECQICEAGHVSLDFLKPRFQGYYLSRDELLSKYKIDGNSKIVLFISSFSYVDLPVSEISASYYNEMAFNPLFFQQLSVRSQEQVLSWFEKLLQLDSNVILIYRPHPAESESELLRIMNEKYQRFYVIGDYSVKQWVLASDIIYTWYSTSIAEVRAAGKVCFVLRPTEIPKDIDYRVFCGTKFICTFEEFFRSIKGPSSEFELNDDMLKKYYRMDEAYAYEIICDKLEEVIKNDVYIYNYDVGNMLRVLIRTIRDDVKAMFNRLTYLLDVRDSLIIKPFRKTAKIQMYLDNNRYMADMIRKNTISLGEYKSLEDKINKHLGRSDDM